MYSSGEFVSTIKDKYYHPVDRHYLSSSERTSLGWPFSLFVNDYDMSQTDSEFGMPYPITSAFARITTADSQTIHIRAESYTNIPSVPKNVSVDGFSDHVRLSWECPAYDGFNYDHLCENMTHYTVYRDGTEIGQTTGLTYTDGTVSSETQYTTRYHLKTTIKKILLRTRLDLLA